MAYTRNPQWKDHPDTSTPITAAKLENMESGIVGAYAFTQGHTVLDTTGMSGTVTLSDFGSLLTINAVDPVTVALAINSSTPNGRTVLLRVPTGWSKITWGAGVVVSGTPTSGTQVWATMVVIDGAWNVVVSDSPTIVRPFENIVAGTNAAAALGNTDVTGYNIILGYAAADVLTSGVGNVAIGTDVLGNATAAGNNSVAIGSNAQKARTGTGNNNVSIGNGAHSVGTMAGADNVAVGSSAGLNNSTGLRNAALGALAGQYITTGGSNVAVGYNSGPASGSGTASSTVSIGVLARASGFSSVAIGNGATATHANAVVLGGYASTADNQVMVGTADVEITDATKGVVLKSPNGTRYRVTVSDAGALVVAAA